MYSYLRFLVTKAFSVYYIIAKLFENRYAGAMFFVEMNFTFFYFFTLLLKTLKIYFKSREIRKLDKIYAILKFSVSCAT